MIEIQCTSCQTRYRIDERILPDETPTFKCSRCGHVFSAEPRGESQPRRGRAKGGKAGDAAGEPEAPAAKTPAQDTPAAAADTADAAPDDAADEPRATASTFGAGAPRARAGAAPSAQPPEPAAADAAAARSAEPPQAPSPAAAPPPADEPETADLVAPETAHAPVSGAQAADTPPPAPPAPAADGAGEARGATLASGAKPASGTFASTRWPVEQPMLKRPEEDSGDDAEPGDNLSFDFSDDARETFSGLEPSNEDREEKWEVGEPPPPPPPPVRKGRHIRATDVDDVPDGSRDFDERISHEEASAAGRRLEAELRGRSYTVHSAGFFIGLFALMIFGFGLASLVISGAPIASARLLSSLPVVGPRLQPAVSPAQRVALTHVQASYTSIKDNQNALIISGVAENVSTGTLGAVQIEAALVGPGQQVLRAEAVYCGNNLSPAMVSEMTPRELEFFEKLGAPRHFSLAAQTSAPFLIVFVEPPSGASRFQLRVAKAEPVAAAALASAGS